MTFNELFVMLIVVTIFTKYPVYADPIDEADLNVQLFKQTFFQHLTSDPYHATRFEVVKKITQRNTNDQKNVTQLTVTQRNETQKNVTENKRPLQQTKVEMRPTPDCIGKKCPEYEVEDADREDHITQLVDDMFVNTDSEITSLQVNENEDMDFSSAADSQTGQDLNFGIEDNLALLLR